MKPEHTGIHRPTTYIVYQHEHFRAAFFHEETSNKAIRYIMQKSASDFFCAMESGWKMEVIDECTGQMVIIQALKSAEPEQCIYEPDTSEIYIR